MSFSVQEKLYHLLPYPLQNLAVSVYGKSLYRMRYGEPFERIYREVEAAESVGRAEIERRQLEALREIVAHAATRVPYYAALFDEIDLNPSDIDSLGALAMIPVLDKETFRARADSFRSTDSGDRTYFVQATSGSSGKPIAVEVDEVTYKLAMALVLHHEQLNGVPFGAPRATFAGKMIKRIDDTRPPFGRYNKAENQMLFSAYHIGPATISHYVDELDRFRPLELIGYPSAIYSLAFEIDRAGVELDFAPSLVVTNSETVLDWQRELIEAVFSCPLRDYYGTAEYLVFARQCDCLNYHVEPGLGLLEVLDDGDRPIRDGEGEIACTTLVNRAMPLFRYKVGDRAVISSGVCGCGSELPFLERIIGRVDDYVQTLDGRKIGRLDHIYKKLSNIREGQIVQTAPDECVVKIVKSGPDVVIDEASLVKNFQERVGSDMKIRLEYLDRIEKGANGKFKAVVSLVDDTFREKGA